MSDSEEVPFKMAIPPLEEIEEPPVNEFGFTYWQDGLYSVHNTGFMQEPRFAAAYQKARKFDPWGGVDIHWRCHVLCWAADVASRLEGDFVECGVNRGGTATAIAEYVDLANLPKSFYLLDTFKGLDETVSSEAELEAMDGVYSECYREVKKRFSSFRNVVLIRGAVPGTLVKVPSEKISFLHIDLNAAEPEIATIDYFWPRMVRGGLIVLDDYGWVACRAQKVAMDQFALAHGFTILSLPTGQGLFIKS